MDDFMIYGVKWYYWLLLVLFAVLAVILWRKAIISSRERRERLKKEGEIWRRDYELRQKFAVLSEKTFSETEDSELMHGAAMNIQIALEKADNMTDEFYELEDEQKCVYALEYFNEDAQKSLSTFLRNNGEPLVSVVPDALRAVGITEYVPLIEKLMPMFDEDSDVSIDEHIISQCDARFKSLFDSEKLCNAVAEFIKENKEAFIQNS